MASATTKPEKRLGEFLKEQQEPFILELYLLERGYSTPNGGGGDSAKSFEKKKSKALFLFPFSKVLTALHKKLAFHNQSKSVMINNSTRKKHANVGVPPIEDQSVDQTDRLSTGSSSTMFHSCSDTDDELEDQPSSSSPINNPLFSSDTGIQSQQDTNNGKHRQGCLEVSMTHETMNRDVSVWGIEERIHSCGVLVPKKLTEDTLLSSAALWSSIINTYNKELQMDKTKQLLFDCVKEMTINVPRKEDRHKGCKQFMGPEKIIWEKTRELSQRAETENLDSMNEWGKFEPQVKDISVEIADEIFDEIVREMVEFEILSTTNKF